MSHEIGPEGFFFSENVGFWGQLPVITSESGRSEVVVGATSLLRDYYYYYYYYYYEAN